MSNLKKDSPIETVTAVAADLTQDWDLDPGKQLMPETLLAADLGFTSIDIIQFCVALDQVYARRLGFQDLLMKDGSYIGDVSLRQFADFIDSRLHEQGDQS
jgi:acyl carrier protein